MMRPGQGRLAETPVGSPTPQMRIFGARIAFAGEVEALLPAIASSLPGVELERLGAIATSQPADVLYRCTRLADGEGLCLERDGSELARGAPEAVLESALAQLHFDVAVHARTATFLHASVVRWRGRLLVFPGRSGAGKSTLAAYLAERGGTYYSDEYAPIDDRGRIHAFPRAIALRPDVRSWFTTSASAPTPTGAASPAAIADAIVFTRFRAAERFQPRPLTVEAAALSLIDNAVGAAPRPRQTAAAVARLLAHGPRLGEGPRGELEDFATALDHWLATG